jgi:hypothetical protein
MTTIKQLVTRNEMAALLKVSPRHLWRMQDILPAIRLGKSVRYDVEDTFKRLRSRAGGQL